MPRKTTEMAWPLWGLALSCSWLLPAFSQLWPSFDMELCASLSCLGLLWSTDFIKRPTVELPPGALVIAGISLIPQAQFLIGRVNFFGDAWMSSTYLLGFACCIVIGANLRGKGQFLSALSNAILFSATVSVGIAIAQWLGSEELSVWARGIPRGERPFANLGQPNNLATLITWGLIALWHGYLSKEIRPSISLIGAAYLLFGLSLTQSRSGWLNVCTLLAATIFFRKQLAAAGYWRSLAWLGVFFLALVLMLDMVSIALGVQGANTLASRVTAGYRLDHWHSMLLAMSLKPWLGWGWNQVSVAQQAVAPMLPPLPEIIGYSHNLFIDLMVWNGIPVGVALSLLIATWLAKVAKNASTPPRVMMFMMLITLFTHSLVEFPYAYAYFLMPTGLLVGMVMQPASPMFRFSRPWLCAVLLTMSGLAVLLVTTRDYLQARQSFTDLRFERARIGPARDSRPPLLPFLTQLKALATTDRLSFGKATDADLELLRQTSERYPSERTIMQYAVAAAAIGDTPAALLALSKLCKLHSKDDCLLAQGIWENWGQSRYPWLKSTPFPAEP